jgi:hypothetical protein
MNGAPPRHEPRPELYGPLLARFQPSAAERWVGRRLLSLLRLPGTSGLLRAWHARRARRRP